MAIFRCEFDSIAKSFMVFKDDVEVPNVESFMVYEHYCEEEGSCMCYTQKSSDLRNPDGTSSETRVCVTANKKAGDSSSATPQLSASAREIFRNAFANLTLGD